MGHVKGRRAGGLCRGEGGGGRGRGGCFYTGMTARLSVTLRWAMSKAEGQAGSARRGGKGEGQLGSRGGARACFEVEVCTTLFAPSELHLVQAECDVV